MVDILILLAGLAIALGLAFITSGLNGAYILVPVDPKHPVPPKGSPTLFRFITVRQVRDHTGFRPRLLVALILAVLLAVFGKLALGKLMPGLVSTDWSTMFTGIATLLIVSMFAIAGWVNTMAILVVSLLPGGIAYYFDLGTTGIGLCGGLMFGAYAGIYVSFNWRSMIHRLKLELRHGETFAGERISALGRYARLGRLWVLRLVPLMVLYNCVTYWWVDVELAKIAENLGSAPGRFALLTIALGLGLNIVIFTVPLIREMLEKGNLQAAADFTEAVGKFHGRNGTNPVTDDDVQDYLSKKGEWLTFAHEQLWISMWVVTMLAVVSMGEMLEKGIRGGLITPEFVGSYTATLDWFTPAGLVTVLGAVGFCANVMFIIGMVAALPGADEDGDGEPDERDAAELYMEVLWECVRNDGTFVTCVEAEDDSDPVVRIHDPHAVAAENDNPAVDLDGDGDADIELEDDADDEADEAEK